MRRYMCSRKYVSTRRRQPENPERLRMLKADIIRTNCGQYALVFTQTWLRRSPRCQGEPPIFLPNHHHRSAADLGGQAPRRWRATWVVARRRQRRISSLGPVCRALTYRAQRGKRSRSRSAAHYIITSIRHRIYLTTPTLSHNLWYI